MTLKISHDLFQFTMAIKRAISDMINKSLIEIAEEQNVELLTTKYSSDVILRIKDRINKVFNDYITYSENNRIGE